MPVIMAGSMLVLHLVGRGTGRDWEMCVCVAMCVWTEDVCGCLGTCGGCKWDEYSGLSVMTVGAWLTESWWWSG